mgnify:CR=1 FL=1
MGRYEKWRYKSLNEFIGRQGASFFFVGLIVALYFYIANQYVSYLALGMMIVGLIMVWYAGDEYLAYAEDEEEDEIDYSEYNKDM